MTTFSRYAIYAMPEPGPLATYTASWLGWDAEAGEERERPRIDGIDLAQITRTPGRYGFHATLKAPFRLLDGHDGAGLAAALRSFARETQPVTLAGLKLARLGRVLALVADGEAMRINRLAALCLREFDCFRAPAGEEELARRRAAGLTAGQERNLQLWGYPYVLGAYHFHMTLTGRIKDGIERVETVLKDSLAPLLPRPFSIPSLVLAGENGDGRFVVIERVPLTGGEPLAVPASARAAPAGGRP